MMFRPSFSALRRPALRITRKNTRLKIETLEAREVPAAFTAGNLVIARAGDGNIALSNLGNELFLDEYTPAGVLVQSVAMPKTASGSNRQLIIGGTATAEGLMTRSADGEHLVLAGYGRDLGGTGTLSGTSPAVVPRVIGLVSFDGSIDTTTALTDLPSGSQSPRGAASSDGSTLWISTQSSGVFSTTKGSTTSTQLNSSILTMRYVNVYDGQLYTSASTGSFRLGPVGTGLPTTSGQSITNLPGFPTTGSPYGFFFADLDAGVAGVDTLYVSDDGAGALQKFSLVAGAWAASGTVGVDADDYRGLTGVVSGTTVSLYATRKGTEFVSVIDSSGYNGTITASPTLLASSGANKAFRGIAPSPEHFNVAPVNELPATFTGLTEDTATVLSGISVSDSDAGSNNIRVTISVPTGKGTFFVKNDVSGGVAAGDITDNGTGVIVITSTVAKINTTLGDANGLTFTPGADVNGNVTLTMVTNDLGNTGSGGAKEDSDTSTITLSEVNDAVTAFDDALTSSGEDSGVRTIPFTDLTGNDLKGPTNEDGQALTVITVSNEIGGTVSIQGTNVLFSPAANFFGSASFDYEVQDDGTTNGAADFKSDLGQATFTITGVADTPSVTGAATDEDVQTTTGLVISRNLMDDTEVTHFRITNIQDGTLFYNDGTTPISNGDFILFDDANAGLKFTPATDFFGTATFDVQASTSGSDAGLGGGVATATITVTVVLNDPSVTDATTDEDTQSTSGLVITPDAADVGKATHFQISNIANGSLYLNDGITPVNSGDYITVDQGGDGLRFSPTPGYSGSGSFDVQVAVGTDGLGLGGNVVGATITVNPVADTPSVTNASTTEDTQTTSGLVISRSPDDGPEVTHFKITNILNGNLFLNDGITPVAPGSFIDFASANAGLKFTPLSNFHGTGSFSIQASVSSFETGLGGLTISATINVTPVGDPPTITPAFTTEEVQTTSGLVFSINPADSLEISHFKITNIVGGSLFLSDGTTPVPANSFITLSQGMFGLKFTPAPNFFGSATFDVQPSTSASEAGVSPTTVTANITVSPVADTPSISTSTTNEDTQNSSGLVVSRNPADSTEVTHFKITGIQNGLLFLNNGTTPVTNGTFLAFADANAGLKFTPNTNFHGNGTFNVQSSLSNDDLGLGGAAAVATIIVNPVADTPSITPASTTEDVQTTSGLVVSRNAVDGVEVTHFKITNILNGTLFLNDGVTPVSENSFVTFTQANAGLKFTPAASFSGTGSFLIQGSTSNSDAGLGGPTVSASISVGSAADTPSVTGTSTNEDVQSSSGLVVSRNASDGIEVTHFKITNIQNGTLFLNDGTTAVAAGSFLTFAEANAGLKFTPAPNFFGNGSFDVQASLANSDGGLGGAIVTATIIVNPINDAPILDPDFTQMLPYTPAKGKILPPGGLISDLTENVNDPDGAGEPRGIAVIAVDNTKGIWQYNLTGSEVDWKPIPTGADANAVSASHALLLADDGTTRLRFLPVARFAGFANILFKAWDQSNGQLEESFGDTTNVLDLSYSLEDDQAWVAVGKTKIGKIVTAVDPDGRTILKPTKSDTKTSATVLVRDMVGIAGLESPLMFNPGVAIIGNNPAEGTWEYMLGKPNPKVWIEIGAVSPTSALLLRPTDKLRFKPMPGVDGDATLKFLTWDQTGPAGTKVNPTGASFGVEPGTAALDFVPVLDLTAASVLNPVDAGQTSNEVTFGSIMSANHIVGANVGVAITAKKGAGTWQYKPVGGNWTDVGKVSGGKALFLDSADQVRFKAAAGALPGTASLSFKAWDKTKVAVGTRGAASGTSVSKLTEILTVAIGNQAPTLDTVPDVVLSGVQSSAPKPSSGVPVKSFLGTAISDPNGVKSLQGIAITGVDNLNGQWEYSLGGNVWVKILSASNDAAVLLKGTSKIRFVPNAGFVGSATFTYKAWDQTVGQAGDRIDTDSGLNSFSLNSETATINVTL